MRALLFMLLCAGAVPQTWAALPSTSFPEHPGAAITMDMEAGACVNPVPVVISTKNPAAFERNSSLPEKTVAWARQTATAMCPNTSRIELIGLLNNAVVYESLAIRANNWALARPMDAPSVAAAPAPTPPPAPRVAQTPPVPQPGRGGATTPAAAAQAQRSVATAASAIARCDALASHPDDPEAIGAGVADEAINAAAAIPACEAAVKADASTPRLHFQLARAYLQADRFEDAIDALITAAEEDHGGALAYLADLHLSGAPGIEEDPAMARTLLEKAVASGFMPAQKVLDEFEDMTAEYEQALKGGGAMAGTPAPTTYKRPDVIQNILQRRYDQVPGGEKAAKQYLVNIADNIAAICKLHFSSNEIQQMRQSALLNVFNFTGNPQPLAMPSTRPQIDILGHLTGINPMPMPTAAIAVEPALDEDDDESDDDANHDTEVLLERLGCESAELRSFSLNIKGFVKNEDAPITTPDALLRRCVAEARPSVAQGLRCECVGQVLRVVPVARATRKAMNVGFWPAAEPVVKANANIFQQCR